MTKLTYRGVTHHGQQTTGARAAQNLIYRGVRHDGLGKETPAPSRSVVMRYRGVAYTLAKGAARPATATATATGATGQIASAPEFA